MHLSPFSERVREDGGHNPDGGPLAAGIPFRPLPLHFKSSVVISRKSSESSIGRISYRALPANLSFRSISEKKDASYIVCNAHTDGDGCAAAQIKRQILCTTRFKVDD